MALQFQLSDKIRLSRAILNNGVLNTGLTVRVSVYNLDDGSVLLSNVTCNAATTGVYYYIWTHARTVKTWCAAVFTVTGLLSLTSEIDYFTIDDSLSADLSESGKAF